MDIETNIHVSTGDNDIPLNNDALIFRKMNEVNFTKKANTVNNNMTDESPIIKPHGNKRRQPHPVNIYFEFFRENFEAVCNMCKKKVKCPKTFNLKRHLARYHAEEFKRVEALWNQINSEKMSANGNVRKNSPSPAQISAQQAVAAVQKFAQQQVAANFHQATQNLQQKNGPTSTLLTPLLSHMTAMTTTNIPRSPISSGSNSFSPPNFDFSGQSCKMTTNFLNNMSADLSLNSQLTQFLTMLQNVQAPNTSPTSSNERIVEIPQPKQQHTSLLRKDKIMDGLLIKKLPKINKEEDPNEKARRLLTCYALTAKFSLVDMDNSFLRELLSMIPNFEVPTSKGLTDLMIDAVIKYGD
uniref:BED-type domain-containing protein n=1 Tax=Parastrongyloides trichosuri TaxID=131310 RepID=A0A0N5A322_PARTI